MSSRSEEVAGKSDVSCKDTKVTSEAIYETLQGLNSSEAKHLNAESAGLAVGWPEVCDPDHCDWCIQRKLRDYRQCDDAEEDEESPLSSESEEIEDDNTTAPLLAHKLLVPYNRMPKPRIFRVVDGYYTATVLPRRPRSPVRHLLPERFDVRARIREQTLKQQEIPDNLKELFKTWILQSVKYVLYNDIDLNFIICMLMLLAICEHVTLSMTDANIRIDIYSFIDASMFWALTELQTLHPDMLTKHITSESQLDSDTIPESREKMKNIVFLKLRRVLVEMDYSKFGQLHRCLPWTLVGAAHQRGAVNFYPTARQRINEIVPEQLEYRETSYVPDVTCFHFGELLHKPDNALYDRVDSPAESGVSNEGSKRE